ncbi:hypothetical protein AKJ50_01800 [candidate division MSBL1 archaeon SCGC-AAA382A13]|uniref:Zinc-ribbon domain-containing protein n=1 Tax=candidate division MSBL1 archaeon SCGC-AAA382A13 TaxID=1698279 RepID=A0A133VF01_9EURY|nr:hypothetical protein AKJ50_01800 [candidate division MSBL1 archaeon SCGC-AAA382A13]
MEESKDETVYCRECGTETDRDAKFCSECGARMKVEVSDLWYLVSVFLAIVGGLIAWLANKDKDPEKARNFLIVGTLITVIPIAIALIAFFSLSTSTGTEGVRTTVENISRTIPTG